jgi:hypothetical protein
LTGTWLETAITVMQGNRKTYIISKFVNMFGFHSYSASMHVFQEGMYDSDRDAEYTPKDGSDSGSDTEDEVSAIVK